MLATTAEDSTLDIANQMGRSFARLANVPAVADAGYAIARQQLLDEVLNSDTLNTYLVVSNTPHDVPRVTVLHSVARYYAGFGGVSAFQGRILGLLGEMVGDQLPPLIQFPVDATADLLHGFLLENVTVQPQAAVDAFFAAPGALELMPKVTVANGGVNTELCCLCPIPIAWAPYFMDSKTPIEALRMGHTLVATMANAAERVQAEPLLDWLRVTSQRMGVAAHHRTHSIMDQDLEATAPSRQITEWMSTKVRQFRQPQNLVIPQGVPGGMGGGAGDPGRVAGFGAAAIGATGFGGAGTTEFSDLDQETLQAACGLTDDQYDTDLPPLYPRMLREGKKTAKVRALLIDVLRPTEAMSLEVVVINVTNDMATDIKELNFAYGGDLTYALAHRGISPFTVVNVTLSTASSRRRKAERALLATHLTMADIADNDSHPDPIPKGYDGFINLLRRYLLFLERMVGNRCPHRIMVFRLADMLVRQRNTFEAMTPRQIASLIWQIFLDARRFFAASTDGDDRLPTSNLAYTCNAVAAGIVNEEANVPYDDLVGGADPWSR
jgi:hypothetical protein